MAHYAYLNQDGLVTQVIVGKDEGEDGIDWEEYYGAVRCSYNTHAGKHYNEDGSLSLDQSKAYRFNYPAKDWFFDPNFGSDGAFIPPKPYSSWVLNESTALWEPPIPYPDNGVYEWDEETTSWIEIGEHS